MTILFKFEEVIEFVNYYNSLTPVQRVTLGPNSIIERDIVDILDRWVRDKDKALRICPRCGLGFEDPKEDAQ